MQDLKVGLRVKVFNKTFGTGKPCFEGVAVLLERADDSHFVGHRGKYVQCWKVQFESDSFVCLRNVANDNIVGEEL